MRALRLISAGLITGGALLFALQQASAQQAAPGLPVQARDCQTVRTCNFARTGAVRGCLSSYTCRTCRLVAARCQVGSPTATCQEMRCSWGG